MIKCSNCGGMVEEGKNFCPNCGNRLMRSEKETDKPFVNGKRTGFPMAGGILLIIAAVFCFLTGFLLPLTAAYYSWIGSLIILIFGIWGFAIGLAGGIYSLKRNHFSIAIIGSAFVLVYACVNIGVSLFSHVIYALFGILILILSILSIIFIAVSKNEFQRK